MCVLLFEYDKILDSWRRLKKIRMITRSGATGATKRRGWGHACRMVRLLVAALTCLTLAPPVHATGTPTVPGINTTTLSQGSQLLNSFTTGQININQFTSTLAATGNISLPDATQLATSIIGNNSATLGALGNVVNSVMTGNINPQAAIGLAGVANLGNIANVGDLAKVISNPAIQAGLNTVLQGGNIADITKQFGSIFGAAATTQLANTILQQAGVAGELATQVAGILGPAATAALGGVANIQISITIGIDENGNITIGVGAGGGNSGGQPGGQTNNNNVMCNRSCPGCCNCHVPIVTHHKRIRALTTNEFESYRTWLVSRWYIDNMLPALMSMTSQMTAAALYQVETFGMMLDAKHQLETQRLFQQMTARAHKDYQPSEGLCEFGTNTRSLAASERRADLSKVAFAERMLQRSLKSGDTLAVAGSVSDKASRLQQFLDEYCDKNDNGKAEGNKGGLEILCKKSIKPERQNKDIDFTRTLDTPLSLDVDFTLAENTNDEKDVFALAANLYAHDIPEKMGRSLLASSDGDVRPDGYPLYMDLRSITAKRSVAQNSVAAMAAMKSRGAKDVAPFLKAFIKDLGLDETEINKLIGEEPSYFAQMEVLTKKVYENPVFYANLYDKPANVERKIAVMEALEIMQDRDIYDSLLRGEAVLAVYLETLLGTEQERVSSEINRIMSATNPADTKGSAADTGAGNTGNNNSGNSGNNESDNTENGNNNTGNTGNTDNSGNSGNNGNTGGSGSGGTANNSAATGATMWNNLSNGTLSNQDAADILTQTGHINADDALALVNGLRNTSNIDREAKARILDSVLGGSMHPQVALGLATTQNLGNINGTADLARVLNNADTRAGLNAVHDQLGAAGLAQHIGLVLDTAGNYPLVGRINSDPATMDALMDQIEDSAPDLVDDAGGRSALEASIRTVIQGSGYLSPPAGGWDTVSGGAAP